MKRNYDDVVFINVLSENIEFLSNELKNGQANLFYKILFS
jgi:hypothetical protein